MFDYYPIQKKSHVIEDNSFLVLKEYFLIFFFAIYNVLATDMTHFYI